MPGTFKSGRKRTRQRVEEARRLNAADYCHANGLPTVEKTTPDGLTYELGTCPKCHEARRDLFKTASGVSCRKCAKLIYSSVSERNSAAERIKRDPKAAAEAMKTMQDALETNDDNALEKSARVLEIAATVPTAAPAQPVEFELLARIQERVISDDLATSTALLELVKDQLLSGQENYTDRRGHASKIPARADSVAKLVNAFCSLSNLRANRAGLATMILESRSDGSRETLRDLMRQQMSENGHKSPSGHSLAEIEAAKPKPRE